ENRVGLMEQRNYALVTPLISREELTALARYSADLTMILDSERRIRIVEPGHSHLVQADTRQLIGQPFLEIIASEDRAQVDAAFARAGEREVVDARILTADGEPAPYELRITNRTSAESVKGYVVAGWKAERLRRVERRLERLRALIQHS